MDSRIDFNLSKRIKIKKKITFLQKGQNILVSFQDKNHRNLHQFYYLISYQRLLFLLLIIKFLNYRRNGLKNNSIACLLLMA